MAKPEYAIREVSLAEVILFLLSVIILAAYHSENVWQLTGCLLL